MLRREGFGPADGASVTRYRDTQKFGQLHNLFLRATPNNFIADIKKWALGLEKHACGLLDQVWIGTHFHRDFKFSLIDYGCLSFIVQDIFWIGQKNRAGGHGGSKFERSAGHLRNL